MKLISVWLLIIVLVGACTVNPPAAQTPQPPTLSNGENQSPAVEPSPTIPLPGLVWLVVPAGGEATAQTIQAWLEQKTSASNLILEVRSTADLNNPPENLQLVIFSTADPQSAELSARLPGLPMIILNDETTPASRYISVIRPSRAQQAFIAGFIATLVASDFRSGALINQDDPFASQLEDSFKNGGRYLCGRCAPVYAPIVLFPQTATFSPSNDPQNWIAAFDALHQNRLETVYLSDPALIQPALLDQITRQNVAILSVMPAPEEYRNQWIATLQPDWLTPLENAWQNWQNGSEGAVWETGTLITNINSERLTEGKLELTKKTLRELEQGWIYPLSVP
jgi:hypothetical protein